MWPDVWSADLHLLIKSMVNTWHRMSLLRPGVIKQHKPANQPTFWYSFKLIWSKFICYSRIFCSTVRHFDSFCQPNAASVLRSYWPKWNLGPRVCFAINIVENTNNWWVVLYFSTCGASIVSTLTSKAGCL